MHTTTAFAAPPQNLADL